MLNQLVFNNGEISDNFASVLLSHDDFNQVTVLQVYKHYELIVCSCVEVLDPDDKTLVGKELFKLVENNRLSADELIAFLRGDEINADNELYEFESCAWFEWRSTTNDWVSAPFDTLFEHAEKNIELLNQLKD